MPLSFEDLYESMRKPILELGFRMTGDRQLAEDILQEAFLQVHRALAGFRGDAAVETWVYRIAIRTASRLRRRRERRREEAEQESPANQAEVPDGVQQREAEAALHAAIGSLPEEFSRVMALLGLAELGAQEVADILGIPEGTVWSRAHKGRKLLRARLSAHAG